MTDFEKAKQIFEAGGYTFVMVKGDAVVSSNEGGILPLYKIAADGRDMTGYAAADKIVGRAAAFLYALIHVKELFAEILSREAEEILRRYGVSFQCGKRVDYIENRRGDGKCPMEKTVENVNEPTDALAALKGKLTEFGLLK